MHSTSASQHPSTASAPQQRGAAQPGAGPYRGTPRIARVEVVPVAGYDGMLLNLSGAHAPFFTRNLLILTDTAGNTGVGEVPGGERIRQTLEDARPLLMDQPLGNWNAVLNAMRTQFAARDAGGRGLQTFDLRVAIHAVTATESALLDLLGQFLGVPVAALLGDGLQRDKVAVLGYLFRGRPHPHRPALPQRTPPSRRLEHACATNRPWTPSRVVRLAQAAHARYGFRRLQAQGRRAARRGRNGRGGRPARSVSPSPHHHRPQWRLALARRRALVPRPARRAGLRRRPLWGRRRAILGAR